MDGDEFMLRDDMFSFIVESWGGFYKLIIVFIDGFVVCVE